MKVLNKFDEGFQRLLGIDINGMETHGMKLAGLKNAEPMSELLSLNGKVAIVTGGAMGLGACIVNRLCEAGAKVVIADIAREYAGKVIEFFTGKGFDVKFHKTDVRDIKQINSAVDYTVREYGKLDILVSNTAHWRMEEFLDVNEEDYDAVVDTGLKGTYFFDQAAAKQMAKQESGGKIVNIGSVAGISMESSVGCLSSYVAAKSGVVGISQSLARELKPLGITINCVIPGGMLTPGAMNMDAVDSAKAKRQGAIKAPIADPDEVARVVYMMCTGIASFMHGEVVVVDGGTRLMIQE